MCKPLHVLIFSTRDFHQYMQEYPWGLWAMTVVVDEILGI